MQSVFSLCHLDNHFPNMLLRGQCLEGFLSLFEREDLCNNRAKLGRRNEAVHVLESVMPN